MDDVIYVDAIGTAETTIIAGIGTPWEDEPCGHCWVQGFGDKVAVCMLCWATKNTEAGGLVDAVSKSARAATEWRP